jgi:hypothetical protein
MATIELRARGEQSRRDDTLNGWSVVEGRGEGVQEEKGNKNGGDATF